MKHLVIIRHSDAESSSYSSSDFDRKLTDIGREKARLQAKRLKDMNILPDLIITSSAKRALDTTDIIVDVLSENCPIQKSPLLYEDYSTNDFLDLISEISETNNIVYIVGHNPSLSVMASRLDFDAFINFKPCSIGVFEIDNNWKLVEVDNGKLIEFLP